LLLGLGLLMGLATPARAVETLFPERNTTRTLQVSTPQGEPLGEGTLTSWTEGEQLHVLLTYRYADGRRIEESSVLRLQPELTQERWTWREQTGDRTTRQFTMDFGTGRATGLTHKGGKTRRYNEQLKVEPGRTFAGVGFVLAAKNLLPRLRQGEDVQLQAIAFTPKPRKAKVKLSREGSESVALGDKTLTAERVVLHPEIGLAALVVKAPDTSLYFVGAEPPVMVGGLGPVLEPGDPVVRTLVLPRQRAPAAREAPPRER
jgi:hypothetical protein